MKFRIEPALKAGKTRRALTVFANEQPILDVHVAVAVLVHGREEDKIVDVIKETVHLGAHAFGGMTQTEIDSIAAFAHERGIADLESRIARMRTFVVKLFERRRAV